LNARSLCAIDGEGHCDKWTIEESRFASSILVIVCWVCAKIGIPVVLPCFGGTAACAKFFKAFTKAI
jgi:hypothetical protein